MPSISLCIIARDEEASIERCLRSATAVVTESIVIDTGSTDRTAELAAKLGARVTSRPWDNDFSAARNASLETALGDWILVLDCDEELDEPSRTRLAAVIDGTTASGFRMRQRNLTPPGESIAYTDTWLTRLFRRNEAHRYEHRVHEQVAPSITRAGGRIDECDLIILHHGYTRADAQGTSRALRNLQLLEQSAQHDADDPYIAFELGCTYQAMRRIAEARRELERACELDRGRLTPSVRTTSLVRLAQLALARHDDVTARDLAALSLEARPNDSLALQVLALASCTLGDVRTAFDAFSKVREAENTSEAYKRDVDKVLATLGKLLAAKTS